MTAFSTRTLGRSGIEVSALGLGCWAIGGPWTFNGAPAGWSEVDDTESVRALRRAFDLGVTFFDTAANYGAGHSERAPRPSVRRSARRGRHRDQVRLPSRRRHAYRPLLRQQRSRQRRRRPPPRRSRHQPPTARHRLRRRVPTPRRGPHARTRARSPRRPRRTGRRREDPHLRLEHRPSRRDQTVRDVARDAASSNKGSASSTTPIRSCSRCARSSTLRASTAVHSAWGCSPASSRPTPHFRATINATARNGIPDSRTAHQPKTGSTNSPRSATCSPPTAAPSPREHSHGSGPAAPRPSRSRDSRPSPRSRRTAEHSTRAR